ncbi:MAG: CapA family protein [Eubacteriales bacterium]|nr:CapA family protein [Eubacteriales bacterium]
MSLREENRRRRKRKNTNLLLTLIAVAFLAGVLYFVYSSGNEGSTGSNTNPVEVHNPKTQETIDLSIVCVGDIMVHKPQIVSQYDKKSETYNYDNNFQYVKGYIEEADLALGNVETTFGGGTPTGYPSFNAPDALADALANMGLDVALTSNNHLYDKGLSGMKRTLQVLRKAGIATAGTRLPWEKNYTMVDVKGLKVAIVSYTYETPSVDGRTTINSVIISQEAEGLINSFAYETLDEDLKKVKSTIKQAKKAGADIVVCYYHWGEEYQRSPNQWQHYIAEKTVNMGVDIIFASHPHVLQKVEMLTQQGTGIEVPVFYSMGNFLSNQRSETLNNRYTEQGMIARVNLKYRKDTGEVTIAAMDAMRTWMEKYHQNGKDVYTIIPLDEKFENNETLKTSGHLQRAIQAAEDVTAVLGDNYIRK